MPISKNTSTAEKHPNDELKNHSDILIKLLEDTSPVLFHNEHSEPYIYMFVDDHWETWPVRSSQTKLFLKRLYWQAKHKTVYKEAVEQVLDMLESKARFDGERISLYNRIARHEGCIWYDLCDPKWRAVCISKQGWSIVNDPPVRFKRHKHQQPQVVPMRGGSVKSLMRFLPNIRETQDQFLVLVCILAYFIPEFPHVLLYLLGDQGSIKSTLSRLIRTLVDPAKPPLLTLHSKTSDLAQQLSHHYLAVYDNVSYISAAVSDHLCRAVTGDGFTTRKLYTDNEDIIFDYQASIIMNGKKLAVRQSDLLERSVIAELDRISVKDRRSERTMLAELKNALPQILGGIFDTLSVVLQFEGTVHPKSLPRMADFAEWGCIIAIALGEKPEAFLQAYHANIRRHHEEVIHGHVIALAVIEMMRFRPEPWEGTATELLEKLKRTAAKHHIDLKLREWPQSAPALMAKLNDLKVNLFESGVSIETRKGTHGARSVILSKVIGENATLATSPTEVVRETPKQGGDTLSDKTVTSPPLSPPRKVPPRKKDAKGGMGGEPTTPTSGKNIVSKF